MRLSSRGTAVYRCDDAPEGIVAPGRGTPTPQALRLPYRRFARRSAQCGPGPLKRLRFLASEPDATAPAWRIAAAAVNAVGRPGRQRAPLTRVPGWWPQLPGRPGVGPSGARRPAVTAILADLGGDRPGHQPRARRESPSRPGDAPAARPVDCADAGAPVAATTRGMGCDFGSGRRPCRAERHGDRPPGRPRCS